MGTTATITFSTFDGVVPIIELSSRRQTELATTIPAFIQPLRSLHAGTPSPFAYGTTAASKHRRNSQRNGRRAQTPRAMSIVPPFQRKNNQKRSPRLESDRMLQYMLLYK